MTRTHGDLIARLEARLAQGLPGPAAHAEMAPYPGRTRPDMISIEGKSGREAATLVLLYPYEDETAFVLTERQASLRDHSGQIALPGGSRDADETAEQTALREGWEEVGLDPERARVLGRLTPIYIPPSGFSVYPVVAAAPERPPFVAQEAEVAALFDVPLSAFLRADVRRTSPRTFEGRSYQVPHFWLGEREVWGATAMMLSEFAAVLRSL